MSAATGIAQQLFPGRTVAVRVVDDAAIRSLNREFRAVDSATDVLSFPVEDDVPTGHAGDIALSWDAAIRQAGANGNTVVMEAVALLAHGMLHLAGWDHANDAAHDAFDHRTRELCKLFGIEVDFFGH